MGRWKQILEWTLNGLSVVLLAVLASVMVKKVTGPDSRNTPDSATAQVGAIRSGDFLEIPTVQWNSQGRSLILALSLDCPYCRQSLPFYRTLSARHTNALRTIALFPEPRDLAAEFLRANGVGVDVIQQTDLSTLGIAGTPTLILTDDRGQILGAWAGRLSETQETEVLRQLSAAPSASRASGEESSNTTAVHTLGLREFIALRHDRRLLSLIDTRERRWFNVSHIEGARNIPLDELLQRATHEVPQDATVVLFCDQGCACKRRQPAIGMNTVCGVGVSLLRHAGFRDVRVLTADLEDIRNAGIPMGAASAVSLPRLPIIPAGGST